MDNPALLQCDRGRLQEPNPLDHASARDRCCSFVRKTRAGTVSRARCNSSQRSARTFPDQNHQTNRVSSHHIDVLQATKIAVLILACAATHQYAPELTRVMC